MSVVSAFKVEYSKSDRSNCIGCKSTIKKNTIRFAIIVQSPKFDGKIPRWYHKKCFRKKVKLRDVQTINGFESLRWKDQESIRHQIERSSAIQKNETVPKDTFTVQYAKSNSNKCRACELPIETDTLCLSKKNGTNIASESNDNSDVWYHINCFNEIKDDLEFNGTAESFSGFTALKEEDQTDFKQKLDAPTNSNRKRKAEIDAHYGATTVKLPKIEDEIQIKKEQSELLWTYKDALRKEVPQDVLKQLLEFNSQKSVSGEHNLIEAVADCMAFGALEHCPECDAFLVFNYIIYHCTGNITEWTKCSYSTQSPNRKPFEIPGDVKENYNIFKNYEYTKRDRLMTRAMKKSMSTTKTTNGMRTIKEPKYDPKLPLKDYSIVLAGRLSKTAATLQQEIERLGGKVLPVVDATIDVVISAQDEVQRNSKKIQDAQSFEIHIVPVEFLDDIQNDRPWIVIEKLKISTWGILPHIRKQQAKDSTRKASTTSRSKKTVPEKIGMILKNGAAIDPDSGLEDFCHVMRNSETGEIFAAALGAVNITSGKNSYYKIQLLEADTGNQWFLFRGRTGTTYGGKKTEQFDDQSEAIIAFQTLFLDKTANNWSDRGTFKKVPSKFYPLEIDYGDDDIQKVFDNVNANKRSNLPKSVQDLLCFIFNVESMEQALLSFEIDLTKMPLGRLSRNQLNKGYQVLTELQTLIENGGTNNTAIVDASNRFYTLIPHNFKQAKPTILDKIELIRSTTEMIDNLLEIEKAYSMLKETNDKKSEQSIDDYYKKLKCILQPVDQNAEEFHLIEQYMTNTYVPQQQKYTLKLKELFKTTREGEHEKFQKWQSNENRQLLWHGSRKTNFPGILSEGLRIAPSEAPATGYTFGKGVYFADMVSKSAHYCFPKPEAFEGLMLLCEVALGKMHECYQRTCLSTETLPAGTLSVKACGKTVPNPKGQYITDDGILIPMGRSMNAKLRQSSLAYNEFIVYDTDQINMKYLLRVEFHFIS